MRVHLAGSYTVEQFRSDILRILRAIEQYQIGSLEDVDIQFKAVDLDGRETYVRDEQGRHAGLHIAKVPGEGNGGAAHLQLVHPMAGES
jgi:hypothetical protein